MTFFHRDLWLLVLKNLSYKTLLYLKVFRDFQDFSDKYIWKHRNDLLQILCETFSYKLLLKLPLLNSGINVNKEFNCKVYFFEKPINVPPLFRVVVHQLSRMIPPLIKAKANPNYSYNGKSLLMVAVEKQNDTIVKILLRAINDSKQYDMPLIRSIGGNIGITRLLLEAKADTNHIKEYILNNPKYCIRKRDKVLSLVQKHNNLRNKFKCKS